jgi:hypothetical protein
LPDNILEVAKYVGACSEKYRILNTEREVATEKKGRGGVREGFWLF